ncbi:MAG TPA: hypothetical protein VGU69_02000 [Rhizomicrobium sp.]|nr:hypothetical protein [Rhizomicrobium sp.]
MRVLFALTALGALALAGCDLNPPAPQKAAQVVCNCPKPPPAVTPAPEPVPTVTPTPRPHAARHHARRYARHHRRGGGAEDYAYDYHGGSTYTDDTDHHRHMHDWVDGYGRHHAIWDEASAGSDYDPRWRGAPYHGYDVDCPDQPPRH